MVNVGVVNVVATSSLGHFIDLEKVGELEYVHYDSDIYGGRAAYFKTADMRGKVILFGSGKMISVGTKSEQQATDELEKAAQLLATNGLIDHVQLEVEIQNLVATYSFQRSIDLEKLALRFNRVIYEPEQFPGAIVKFNNPPKATALIFASGKSVIVGTHNIRELELIVKRISELIETSHVWR